MKHCRIIAALAVIAGLAFPAFAQHYTVRIEGAPSPELRERMRAVSEAVALQEDQPASVLHLQRRAQRDRDTFVRLLHAEGYYAAAVDVDIDYDAEPPTVAFRIEPGEPYTLETVHLVTPGGEPLEPAPTADALGLKPGGPARAQPVIDANARIVRWYRDAGYPFPRVVERRPVVFHATRTMDVTYVVDPGPAARFGDLTITGLDTVKERFVRERVAWQPGDPYTPTLVDRTRERLYRSGLFASVRIELAKEAEADGRAPVTIALEESRHRTIALGARYHTSEGPGVLARWEHRNITGLGRTLSLEANLSTEEQRLSADYLLPRFRRDNQRLRLAFTAGHEETEAYDADFLESRAAVERDLAPWTLEAGPILRFSRTRQQDDEDTYTLAGLMLRAAWDGSNDPMNPTRGARLDATLEPYVDIRSGSAFVKASSEVRGYLPLDAGAAWVLAARLRVGLTLGAERDAIPPDVRFYAGGGGSIRGYEYRSVAPLDEDDDPLGGRSVVDGSVELRRRISERFGAVVFVDGGSAFEGALPDFGETVQWSAGFGVRYFSELGPFRADLAFPLNARDRDDAFQFYLSLGQAF